MMRAQWVGSLPPQFSLLASLDSDVAAFDCTVRQIHVRRPNQAFGRIEFCDDKHYKVSTDRRVIHDFVHGLMVSRTRFRLKQRMRVPFANIVEPSVVVFRPLKESIQDPDHFVDASQERGDRPRTVNTHLSHCERINADVLTHQNAADLPAASPPERSLQDNHEVSWKN
jgi:hypothetical protein